MHKITHKQQLAQIATKLLSIADKVRNVELDELDELQTVLGNLLSQILDPCDMFGELISVRNVENRVESVITGATVIFYS